MTRNKDFKKVVRARSAKTGESYASALVQLRGDSGGPAVDVLRSAGLNPETASLARVLAALGVTAPHTGRPFTEAMLLGIGGGIGAAYFLFDYKTFTSVYVGGRINPYVQKSDFTETAAMRLGALKAVSTSTTPRAAEKQLRSALGDGPAIAVVDEALLPFYGWPREMAGATPHTVVVTLDGVEPAVTDLAPEPFRMSWADLAAARGRYRAAKNRLLLLKRPQTPLDLEAAVRAGVADAVRGMLRPPMSNFGLSALERWAQLLVDRKDKKGWPTVFKGGRRLVSALRWLYHWIETSGTGGGNFRAMYSRFLEEAAGVLGKPGLKEVSGTYRDLAAQWTGVARAALPDDAPSLRRLREQLDRRARLIAEKGAGAASQVAALMQEAGEMARLCSDSAPPDLADMDGLLDRLADGVRALARGEREAVRALEAAV